MRVLIANKYFYPRGGAEAVLFQERDFLTRHGVEVIIFSMLDSNNAPSEYSKYFVSHKEYRHGSRIRRLRSALSLIHSREAVCKIGTLIDETLPDVLHCHNIYHQLTPSIIGAAKRRGVPVVITVHDQKLVCPSRTRMRHGQPCSLCLGGNFNHVVQYSCADGSRAQSLLLYAEAVVQRWLGNYERVDRIVAPSDYMRRSLQSRFPAERIVLLYNGVDTTALDPSQQDNDYVLYCGRVASGKGIESLLRAHESAGYGWRLIIAGEGPLSDLLKSRQGRNVHFTGQLTGAALTEMVKNASVIVVPSTIPENCPMAALEAMAHGKPVVGARSGGIPEIIDDGVTGFLFDAQDDAQLRLHIDRLMSDRLLRTKMGKAARLRAEALFSLDRHNAGLMNVYKSVIGGEEV
jgi:glycosyltransferase involved in cell wall biosynthesis